MLSTGSVSTCGFTNWIDVKGGDAFQPIPAEISRLASRDLPGLVRVDHSIRRQAGRDLVGPRRRVVRSCVSYRLMPYASAAWRSESVSRTVGFMSGRFTCTLICRSEPEQYRSCDGCCPLLQRRLRWRRQEEPKERCYRCEAKDDCKEHYQHTEAT
jgi:hypothetical protein